MDPPTPPPDEEDAPTQSFVERPPSLTPEALLVEDPASPPEPVPAPTPASGPSSASPPPDPRELARKLAEEARKKLSAPPPEPPRAPPPAKPQEHRMTQEDPRELARRLADEAKRRLQVSAPPPPPDPIVEDEDWVGPPEPEEPEITMAPPPPVTERVSGGGRAMSALEALEAARAAERRQADTRRSAPPPEADRSAPSGRTSEPPRAEAPRAAPRSGGGAPVTRAAAVVNEVFPNAAVESPTTVGNADVFRALWRAHRARAVHTGDLALTVTASVLIDAVDRIAPGCLVACRVTIGEHRFAAWVDAERGALLGLAGPPDVYLTGG